MKKLNIAIMLGLGFSLPYAVQAEEEDVTIRMMEMNETTTEEVMKEIELPESASDMGRERSAKGIANANARHERNRLRKEEHEGDDDEVGAHEDMDSETETEHDNENEMIKEDHLRGLERAAEVRATPERPELPELPEAAESHRSDNSKK